MIRRQLPAISPGVGDGMGDRLDDRTVGSVGCGSSVLNAVAGNLNGVCLRPEMRPLTGEPQVAFLGATDPTADRQSGDHPDQVST